MSDYCCSLVLVSLHRLLDQKKDCRQDQSPHRGVESYFKLVCHLANCSLQGLSVHLPNGIRFAKGRPDSIYRPKKTDCWDQPDCEIHNGVLAFQCSVLAASTRPVDSAALLQRSSMSPIPRLSPLSFKKRDTRSNLAMNSLYSSRALRRPSGVSSAVMYCGNTIRLSGG